ncbi:caspase, EACC1-associated type [Allocoleopsis sp.]|uniref:caspase, EACC1-associated type n=1 Tax=Allocoleopsis sp. TaxID=3088169 RepID=UPI002FD297C4
MAKVALLVGVSEYEQGLNPLPSAARDVEAMKQVLQHPDIGGFAEADVTVLINRSRQEIEEAIYYLFANRQKDDLLLFYFSGHGVKDELGNLYLATPTTRKDPGRNKLVKPTAVAARVLHESMNESYSKRQIVILDCCFSGAFAKGMTAKDDGLVDIQAQLGGKGRAILTSSTATQYSFEQENSNLSIYTHYLVEGMTTGAGDLDDDGQISVDELHEYTGSRVQEAAPSMTPELYPVEEGYKIFLARAPVGDPKLKYRKGVGVIAREDEGDIDFINRSYLDELKNTLGLQAEEAKVVEAEVLEPYRQRKEKLQRYEQVLAEAMQRQYPLSAKERDRLKRLQQILSLRNEDVEPIEMQLISHQSGVKSQAAAPPREPTSLSLPVFNFDVVTVNAEGREIDRRQGQAQCFIEDLGNEITLEMVAILGGTFCMGSPEAEADRLESEEPQHLVIVKPFFMGKYPITQAQWQAVVALPPVKRSLVLNPSKFKGANHPVETVSFEDAIEFCARLSNYTEREYRLPSEAEWEYACRAGTTTPFHFGETITSDLANYDGSYTYSSDFQGKYREKTTPVDNFQAANAFGLYDMHGNVWEWCADSWHSDYEGAPTDGSVWQDNNGNQKRLLRGGSWYFKPSMCRSACRMNYIPALESYGNGFRVVCTSA